MKLLVSNVTVIVSTTLSLSIHYQLPSPLEFTEFQRSTIAYIYLFFYFPLTLQFIPFSHFFQSPLSFFRHALARLPSLFSKLVPWQFTSNIALQVLFQRQPCRDQTYPAPSTSSHTFSSHFLITHHPRLIPTTHGTG